MTDKEKILKFDNLLLEHFRYLFNASKNKELPKITREYFEYCLSDFKNVYKLYRQVFFGDLVFDEKI